MTVTMTDPSTTDWAAASEHRTPGISIKQLLQRGGEGRSFEFNVVQFSGDDFWSPRHRHNFDQIRIGLRGETSYGPKTSLTPRTIGYFPEGVWYGPQKVGEPSVQAILQFDGPSRCGYVNYELLDRATDQLRTQGTFAKGFYEPAGGGKKIDGYQASWELSTGKQMVYPEPRYPEPVYLLVDGFHWVGEGPVRSKVLGVFGERQTTIEMLRIPAGASTQVGRPGRTVVAFVLDGAVDSAGSPLGRWGAAMVEENDTLDLVGAAETSEIILLTLPTFDE